MYTLRKKLADFPKAYACIRCYHKTLSEDIRPFFTLVALSGTSFVSTVQNSGFHRPPPQRIYSRSKTGEFVHDATDTSAVGIEEQLGSEGILERW